MGQPYLGEIRLFAGNFAPAGWMTCDGQLLAVADYDTLFDLIGTTYGGDGVNTFALPNLAARVPLHMGTGSASTYTLAQTGGVTTVQLTSATIPSHTHAVIADGNAATTGNPSGAYYADVAPKTLYSTPGGAHNPHPTTYRSFNSAMLAMQGGSQPHDNMQPYLAITFIIAIYGVYPSAT
ncbi:MAG TPA: tail fiber protein [Candidatus Sulfotelmatobacter sp.]|nr:tail fiber protein [Candidatus Sulfotelmatobacter sp.]